MGEAGTVRDAGVATVADTRCRYNQAWGCGMRSSPTSELPTGWMPVPRGRVRLFAAVVTVLGLLVFVLSLGGLTVDVWPIAAAGSAWSVLLWVAA